MSNLYNSIPILRTPRSKFNLSYTHKTTCDMGQLIPIGNWICYPNEKYEIGNQAVIRLQPLAAPLMHRIKVKVATFFVPFRILWDGYEDWANSGIDGEDILSNTLPLWDNYYTAGKAPAKYSLWDYFGRNTMAINDTTKDPDKYFVPNDMLRRAYNRIYNEYFINRNIQSEIAEDNNNILYVNFKNDYFASALPFQQRGIDPAIALSFNDVPIVWDMLKEREPYQYNIPNESPYGGSGNKSNEIYSWAEGEQSASVTMDNVGANKSGFAINAGRITADNGIGISKNIKGTRAQFSVESGLTATQRNFFANLTDSQLAQTGLTREEAIFYGASRTQRFALTADNSNLASTFDANELRLLMQTKKFLERNARCGSRYNEQLLGRWGVFAGDARLNRPEFIYSTTNAIAVEELPQLSEDGETPQGHLVGKGLGAQSNSRAGYYTTKEHGCIIQLMWLIPDLDYIPQGYDRETLIHTRLQEYAPEFQHLSEQMIKKGELYFSGNPATDNAQFGYQPIWSELRHRRNVITGDMRDTFDYWHLGRKFANQPSLNEDFIKVNGESEEFKRIFATGTAAQGFIVAFGNECKCLRPLAKYGTPGFVDHF